MPIFAPICGGEAMYRYYKDKNGKVAYKAPKVKRLEKKAKRSR